MIDSALFIGALIIALTEAVRIAAGDDAAGHKRVKGLVTMVVAVGVGILVSVLGVPLGLTHISIAQGILIALGAVGVHTTASAVNTSIKS